MRKYDYITVYMIVLFFLYVCVAIASTVYIEKHKPPVEQHQPQPQYPPIPQCDKELWDRIREGCTDVLYSSIDVLDN